MMNGSWVISQGIVAPWRAEVKCEMYDRGQWVVKAVKTYLDFCLDLHNPLEPGYFSTKFLPECPIKAGVWKLFKI